MKVSVLIPVYNSEKFIAAAIKSVLGQSWQNTELIVVDDGSTDASLSVARSFESEAVKIISESNRGACAARNTAYRHATGDFIQYLDADDVLDAHKIEKQMNRAGEKTPGNVLLSGRWYSFTNEISDATYNAKHIDRSYPQATDWLCDAWNKGEMAQTSVWLIPRKLHEASGQWDESLKKNQDGEFFTRVILKAAAIVHVPDAITYYRRGVPGAISNKFSYEAAKSVLASYVSYHHNTMEAGKKDTCLQNGLRAVFAFFLYVYAHHYPDLKAEALRYYNTISGRNVSGVGGRLFSSLCKLVGFRNALSIRGLLTKK